MIKIYDKENIEAFAEKLNTSENDIIRLPNDDIFISFKRSHEGFICFGDLLVRGKKVYVLHRR